MALSDLEPHDSLVILLDLQHALIPGLVESDRVVRRCQYLLRVAALLGIPIVATTQNASRLGGLPDSIAEITPEPFDKLSFSCWRDERVQAQIRKAAPRQIYLCGAEMHICVALSALDLLEQGYAVAVSPDAVGASTDDRHKLGMERMRDAGVVPIHSEALAYELLGGADHPQFREVLSFTKALR